MGLNLAGRFYAYDAADDFYREWSMFQRNNPYPLYCIVMATEPDKEIATAIQDHYNELAVMSGVLWCFIYFRDYKRAKLFLPFLFSEHANSVYLLAELLGLERQALPCLLFFEDITSGEYQTLPIGGYTGTELVVLLRQLSDRIHGQQVDSPLKIVEAFDRSRKLSIAKGALLKNVREFGGGVVRDLLRSLVPFL